MNVIETKNLNFRYGRVAALHDVTLAVPQGCVYALLGQNGAGKTTLLQLLAGLRHPSSGEARIMGKSAESLTPADRVRIGYVAEGQELPGWMSVRQLEDFLRPLYPSWDSSLAADLRRRFRLDPEQIIRSMSRGERMKTALLCALAPQPTLLLMDEPFTGLDVAVRDDLVRGMLGAAAGREWTAVISTHDVAEIESISDWVGFLDRGRLVVSKPIDALREEYQERLATPGLREIFIALAHPASPEEAVR